jgi:hypothetical protein
MPRQLSLVVSAREVGRGARSAACFCCVPAVRPSASSDCEMGG